MQAALLLFMKSVQIDCEKNHMIKSSLVIHTLSFAFLLAGCKKDNSIQLKAQLAGSWELRILYGGQVPGIGPNFPPGNGNTWKFADTTYSTYSNSLLTSSGTYTVTKDNTVNSSFPKDALILNGNPTSKIYFNMNKDTLTLYIGSIPADGTIGKYVRQ
jgi:hypothetical protein